MSQVTPMTDIPDLSPMSEVVEQTKVDIPKSPISISSSISSYSPITQSVTQRESFTANSSQVIKHDLDNIDIINLNRNMEMKYDQFVNESNPKLTNTQSKTSIRTFSSDEDIVEDDSELFETFNGSNRDFATLPVTKPINTEPIDIMRKYSGTVTNDNNTSTTTIDTNDNTSPVETVFKPTIPKFTVRQTSTSTSSSSSSPVQETTPLNIGKTRNAFDPKNDPQYRNLSRSITPANNSAPDIISKKLKEYESQVDELDVKQAKLVKEIQYVKSLLVGLERDESIEVKKLRYALGKLEDRLKDAIKERYDLGIKITKYRRRLYGDESGVFTEYFARKVSLE